MDFKKLKINMWVQSKYDFKPLYNVCCILITITDNDKRAVYTTINEAKLKHIKIVGWLIKTK